MAVLVGIIEPKEPQWQGWDEARKTVKFLITILSILSFKQQRKQQPNMPRHYYVFFIENLHFKGLSSTELELLWVNTGNKVFDQKIDERRHRIS
jgi:hypothetical protein